MLILGIDPGLVQTGFGLINVNNNINKIIDYGVIAPNSKDNLSTIHKPYKHYLKTTYKQSKDYLKQSKNNLTSI